MSDGHLMESNEPDVVLNRSPLHIVRMIVSTVLLLVWVILMVVIHFIWRILSLPNIERSYFIFHQGCCCLFGIRCEYVGEISKSRPTLFLSNHVSYLDVFILGSATPGFFIAKSEVANWPVLGVLAKLQNTLFFERSSKKVRSQLGVMTEHFNQSGNLILFPEGTSTNGEYVQTFKSSLLQSVELSKNDVAIQPVTLTYAEYDGQTMTRAERDQYAWYASMPFTVHFFNALGLKRAKVVVTYHPPISLSQFENRKLCAEACHQQVSSHLASRLYTKSPTM